MKSFIKIVAVAMLGSAALVSCNKLEVTLPKGPQGEQGIQGIQGIQGVNGKDGISAYDVWVNALKDGTLSDWDSTKTTISDYFLYLKGVKGDKGDRGEKGNDGLSAYEVWKEYISGGDVVNPQDPGKTWNPEDDGEGDFYRFLTGAKGDDGHIPYIGDNGNWFIGDSDTGIPATGPMGPKGEDGRTAYQVWVEFIRDNGDPSWPKDEIEIYHYFKYLKGEKGEKGEKGDKGDTGAAGSKGDKGDSPYIGDNGNWFVSGKDTGVPARGPKGDTGATGASGAKGDNGLSAYEVWKRDVTSDKGLDNPKNGMYDSEKWPKDKVSEADFYDYLYGRKGDKGDDGLSAYEVWKLYIAGGDVANPQNPDVKWNPSDNSEKDFFKFLTGPKGDDGLIPYIGTDGNWWIGDENTGKPSRGPKGDKGEDGYTPVIGPNGNWFIGDEDTGIPAKGKDGSDGKDGDQGKNGLSAYEIWKSDVLKEGGLSTPDNGVYDVSKTPTWPTDATDVSDFWLYLKGKDGVDGKDGQDGKDGENGQEVKPVVKLEYSEEVEADKYNVAPVRALMKISGSKSARPDTTYEYVNPYSGGAAFIVTGPGPVIIPDCEVVFTDVKGNRYSKTSDGDGFVYLSREELPEYTDGSPTASKPTKPLSFKYGDVTISDASRIGQTCKVPYRVGLSMTMKKAVLDAGNVTVTSSLVREVEGKTETSCGGVDFPFWDESSKRGYKYYRSPSAIEAYYAAVGSRPVFESGITNYADALTAQNSVSVLTNSANRAKVSKSARSTDYLKGSFGNGSSPAKIKVTAKVYSISSKNGKLNVTKPLPDYGLKIETARKAHVPEIRYIGDIDLKGESPRVTYPKVGTDPDDDDPSGRVKMKWTHYIVVLGQTEFAGNFDLSTFGQCYLEGEGILNGEIYEFQRFDSLTDYMATPSGKGKTLEGYVNVVGTRQGTKIDNHVALNMNGWDVRDLYDGFEVIFGSYSSSRNSVGTVKFGDVHYAGLSATFYYTEGTYTARLSDGSFMADNIQVIYDGFTK